VTDQQITDFLKNDRGTIVSQLIGSIQFHSSVFNVEMWQFAPKLYTKHKSAVLSEIAIQNDELQANGIYLLKEDKLAMHLSADEGKLIHLLIKDKVRDLNIMLQKEQ